jgi:hypothetical protein
MKRLMPIFLLAMFMAGCVSNAETTTDTAPDLYDGSRYIGRVMSIVPDTNGVVISVWIPNLDAVAFYSVIRDVHGSYAKLGSTSRVAAMYESSDCTGDAYCNRALFPGNLIVGITIKDESVVRSYFFDPTIAVKGIGARSFPYQSGGGCQNYQGETTGNFMVQLQSSDIPSTISAENLSIR